MRAVSLIPEGSQLIALAVHGDAEKLTYLPPQTALFTCEKTEDGALRLNTADGWLNPAQRIARLCWTQKRTHRRNGRSRIRT